MVIICSWVGVAVVDFFWGAVRIHFLHGNESFLHSITNSRTLNNIQFITRIISSEVTSVSSQVLHVCLFKFPVGTEEILPPGGSTVKQ